MRLAVLGASGYLGTRLIRALLSQDDVELVVGVGRRNRAPQHPSDPRYRYLSARLPQLPLTPLFRRHRISAMVYLAFASRPARCRHCAYQSDVLSTTIAFRTAAMLGVPHAVLVSSVAVYGPRTATTPADERAPTWSGRFQFAAHKLHQERAAMTETTGTATRLTVVRPCTVLGPAASNFLLDMLRRPLVPIPHGLDPRWQFLHETDFCASMTTVLRARPAGVFNVVPDDSVALREAVRLWGSRAISVPGPLLTATTALGWAARCPLIPAPPSALPFLRHGPLASNRLIREVLHVEFRHTSEQAARALGAA